MLTPFHRKSQMTDVEELGVQQCSFVTFFMSTFVSTFFYAYYIFHFHVVGQHIFHLKHVFLTSNLIYYSDGLRDT